MARRPALPREDQLLAPNRLAVLLDDPRLAPLDALGDRLLARDPRSRLTAWKDIRGEIDSVRRRFSGGVVPAPAEEPWVARAEHSIDKLLATKRVQDSVKMAQG